jgi:superfamily II DNA/RNA helicase
MDTSEKNPFDSSDDEEKLQPKEIERDVSYSPVYQPECESEELEVKPFCECDSCNHFTKSADWCTASHLKFEADNTKKTYKERKLLPLFRSAKHPGKTPKIITFNPDNLTKLERKTLFRTLVHGEAIPQPITLLSDTYFSKDMQSSLQTLNYKYSLPIQSFAWPAIFRQMNVFMIGGHKSGKTMSYLPAVCTFSTQPCCKYDLLEKYKGPLVIIICRNSKQCEEIFDLIKKLYSSIQFKPRIFIMTYPITNIHNTDILITIPESLMHCLKSRIINFKRLCHLVLEDASSLLNQEGETVSNILTVVDQMLQNRVQNIGVQLIVSSEKWTKDLKELFKSIYVTPLVCIGNYLEAALYGNTQFEIKFLMSDQKKAYLEGLSGFVKVYNMMNVTVFRDSEE